MRSLRMGERQVAGRAVTYYLLAEELEIPGEYYGVGVESAGGERVSVPGITVSQSRIAELVGLLIRGAVTPATLRDVVEDWLAR